MTGRGDRINPSGLWPLGFIRSPCPVMSSYIPRNLAEARSVTTLFISIKVFPFGVKLFQFIITFGSLDDKKRIYLFYLDLFCSIAAAVVIYLL